MLPGTSVFAIIFAFYVAYKVYKQTGYVEFMIAANEEITPELKEWIEKAYDKLDPYFYALASILYFFIIKTIFF